MPQTEIGKRLTRIINRVEKLVQEGKEAFAELKELKEELRKPPKSS